MQQFDQADNKDIDGLPVYSQHKWSVIRKVYPNHDVLIITTSSNGNILCVTCLCAGYLSVTGQLPSQRPVTRSFDIIFDPRLNKRLSKQ